MLALLSLLVGFWAVPALAEGPDDTGSTPAERTTWEKMHEACEEGDWDAMTEAAAELHGNDINSMPCHDENNKSPDEKGQSQSHHGDMGDHMDGGMMGGQMGNSGSMMR